MTFERQLALQVTRPTIREALQLRWRLEIVTELRRVLAEFVGGFHELLRQVRLGRGDGHLDDLTQRALPNQGDLDLGDPELVERC